jgi:hypothetical protein
MNTPRDLPPGIAARLMVCLEEVGDEYHVKDMKALVELIAENGSEFPFLLQLVTVNMDAIVKHYEEIGEVPPGIKLVRTTTQEGSNVVGLDVLHGPRTTK